MAVQTAPAATLGALGPLGGGGYRANPLAAANNQQPAGSSRRD
jgi:hypothetical protein